jgi:hypothetical protein
MSIMRKFVFCSTADHEKDHSCDRKPRKEIDEHMLPDRHSRDQES